MNTVAANAARPYRAFTSERAELAANTSPAMALMYISRLSPPSLDGSSAAAFSDIISRIMKDQTNMRAESSPEV